MHTVHHGLAGGWGALAVFLILGAVTMTIAMLIWSTDMFGQAGRSEGLGWDRYLKAQLAGVLVWIIITAGLLTGAALAFSAGYSVHP